MPLALNTATSLVSHQYHCIYVINFDTVKQDSNSPLIWKTKARLQELNQKATPGYLDVLSTLRLQGQKSQHTILNHGTRPPIPFEVQWETQSIISDVTPALATASEDQLDADARSFTSYLDTFSPSNPPNLLQPLYAEEQSQIMCWRSPFC